MLGLTNLHQIAAARGDGLRPELLELLQRAAQAAPNVVQLDQYRSDGMQQAGPVPCQSFGGALPENVVPFRPAIKKTAVKKAAPKRQAPRKSRAKRLTGRIS